MHLGLGKKQDYLQNNNSKQGSSYRAPALKAQDPEINFSTVKINK
jgi:hypothetical protein